MKRVKENSNLHKYTEHTSKRKTLFGSPIYAEII